MRTYTGEQYHQHQPEGPAKPQLQEMIFIYNDDFIFIDSVT